MPAAISIGYTRIQILLHWAVVGLIVVQLLTSDAMEDLHDAVERGRSIDADETLLGWIHAISGLTVLALALARLLLRRRHGAPPPPADLPPLMRLGAHGAHAALYALIIALPATGALALWVESDLADVHEALTKVLWVLVALHIGAALFHAVIRRDGVASRMLRPAP